jgi:hypothetical protein
MLSLSFEFTDAGVGVMASTKLNPIESWCKQLSLNEARNWVGLGQVIQLGYIARRNFFPSMLTYMVQVYNTSRKRITMSCVHNCALTNFEGFFSGQVVFIFTVQYSYAQLNKG